MINCPNCDKEHEMVEIPDFEGKRLEMRYQRIECSCGTVFDTGTAWFDERTPIRSLKRMARVVRMPAEPRKPLYRISCHHMKHGIQYLGEFLEWTLAECPSCGSEYTAYMTRPTKVIECLYEAVISGLW